MNNYQKQALEFLENTNTTMKIEFLKNDYHFADDKEKRDIYLITLKRGTREYIFNFGQSINRSGFYVMQGRAKTELDRKYIKSKNLFYHIRNTANIYFNQSIDTIHYPEAPDQYDILACLTKYDPNTFEDFCSNFGYDTDSIKANKIYEAVKAEYLALCTLFTDEELEQLAEIQ